MANQRRANAGTIMEPAFLTVLMRAPGSRKDASRHGHTGDILTQTSSSNQVATRVSSKPLQGDTCLKPIFLTRHGREYMS